MLEHRPQHLLVVGLAPSDQRRVLRHQPRGRHQQHRERRGHRQRDNHRRQHSERVGDRERPEKRSGEAADEHDREHRDDVDQGRVQDRGADLERGRQQQVKRRRSPTAGAPCAQASDDVLHVDDRVVDDHPHCDPKAGQDHRVDGGPGCVEDDRSGAERKRDRQQADERRPPLEQERDEHEHHQEAADHDRRREVVHRGVDKGGLAEDVGVEADPRQTRPERRDRLVDPVCDV